MTEAKEAPSSSDRESLTSPAGADECLCGCNRQENQHMFETMPDDELLYDLADLFKASPTSPTSSASRKAPSPISCACSSKRASSSSNATAKTSSTRCPTTTFTPCSLRA